MAIKPLKIGRCAVCDKNRALYSSFGLKVDERLFTLSSESPCCQKCFEKEVKKQLKEGALNVG